MNRDGDIKVSIDENLFIKMIEETKELSQQLQTQIKNLFNIIEIQNKLFNILMSDKLGKEEEHELLTQSLPIKKNQAKRNYHFITHRLHGCPGCLAKSSPGRSFFQTGIQKKGKLVISRRKSPNRQTRYRLQTRL